MVTEAGQAPVMRGAGVVLASYGRGVLVESSVETERSTLRCSLKGRKQHIVCGDRIAWNRSPGADGPIVESVAERRNLIERIDARGRPEPVAANVDRLVIVVAIEPQTDWFLVDRYWAAAQLKELGCMLIVNKIDLDIQAAQNELTVYRGLGLPCFEVSARTALGMPDLHAAFAAGVSLLVGQSGVGKSSLVNAIAPHAAAQTAELTRDAEGKHTTTTARRYRLSAHAAIVDAPGVRDFAPPASVTRAAEHGFTEVLRYSAECRFNDCRHLEEPGCAVHAAVDAGLIARRRYESYRRLFRLYERLDP